MVGYPWVDGNVLTGSELNAPFWRNIMNIPGAVTIGSSVNGFRFYSGSTMFMDGTTSTVGSFGIYSGATINAADMYLQFDLGSHYKFGYLQLWGTVYMRNAANFGSFFVKVGSLTTALSNIKEIYTGPGNNTTENIDIPYYNLSNFTGGVRYIRFDSVTPNDASAVPFIKELIVMAGTA